MGSKRKTKARRAALALKKDSTVEKAEEIAISTSNSLEKEIRNDASFPEPQTTLILDQNTGSLDCKNSAVENAENSTLKVHSELSSIPDPNEGAADSLDLEGEAIVEEVSENLELNFQRSDSLSTDTRILKCLIDKDLETYHTLKNSLKGSGVAVRLNMLSLGCITPEEIQWKEIITGVYSYTAFCDMGVKTGYIRVSPKTVKPLEMNKNGAMCFSVMDGKITVKSTSYDGNKKGQPYLKSLSLSRGSHFSVPKDAWYSLENWEGEETWLAFTIVGLAKSEE